MNFIAIIPARSGSKGIRDKNIVNFDGKPLIYWTINVALRCKFIDRVVVSTDSPRIKDVSEKFGASVPFLRPKKISGDKAKTLSAVKYTLKKLENEENYIHDYIVTLQPTSPLREKDDLENAIKTILADKKADSLVSCVKVPHNFLPESLMQLDGKYIKNFSKDKNNFRRQDKKTLFARNGAAIYITKSKNISKYLLGGNILPYFMHYSNSIDIDTKEDLEKALLFKKILKKYDKC